MKKHKETNFPFGSHGVLYVYAFVSHTPSLVLIHFWDCKSIHFRLKKVFYFSTKRLCFAECLFSFMQRWINWRKIRFTVYSILIKAKARSNMNTALIRALTNVKLCVCIKYVMTLPVTWILDKSKAPVSSSWMNVSLCLCLKASFCGNLWYGNEFELVKCDT